MEIKQFVWEVVDSNSWLIIEKNHGLLIDAVAEKKLYEAVAELESLTIILTHSHFDHVVGLNKIRTIRPDCKVIATKLCSEHIGNKYRNMSSSATAFMTFYKPNSFPINIEPFECDPVDMEIKEPSEYNWKGNKIDLYLVYGHTNDGLIVEINNYHLFTGDTLLHVPTATRFPTGNKIYFMNKDIPLLNRLQAEIVYPGHGMQGIRSKMFKSGVKE